MPTADVQPGGGAMGGSWRLEAGRGGGRRCWLRTPPERAAGRFVREGEGYAAAVKLKLLEAATAGATEAALAIAGGGLVGHSKGLA